MFARIAVIVGIAVLAWTIAARPSVAHGDRTTYRVRAHDTLWTIAAAHYAGDVRDAVWRIERANRIRDATVRPGQAIVLP